VFAQFHHAHISELWPDGQSKTAKYFVDKLVEFSKDCDKASVHFYGHTHGFQRGQTRDHAHFYMNVASGEGDLDRWGVYDNQYNSEIIQKVVVQWGWSFVETEAGEDPKFTMRHIGVGSGENDLDFPGTEVDRITYRPKSVPPEKPTITRPKNETLSETTLVLEASAFVGKEKEAKHLSSHFQVTSTSGDYSDLASLIFRSNELNSNTSDPPDSTESRPSSDSKP